MTELCCDYRDHGGNLTACTCDAHPQDSLHPLGWCTWCGGRGCPDCLGPDENACVDCGSSALPCSCPRCGGSTTGCVQDGETEGDGTTTVWTDHGPSCPARVQA